MGRIMMRGMDSSVKKRRSRWVVILVGLFFANGPSLQGADAKPVVGEPVTRGPRIETLRLTGSVFSRRYSKLSAEVEGLVRHLRVDKGDFIGEGEVFCEIDPTFARLDAEEADARVERSKAALAEARRQYDEGIGLSRERIIAESDLQALTSQLRLAELEVKRTLILQQRSRETLDRYELRAPFSGMVVSKQIEEGEWVPRGGTAVTMVELDRVFAEFLVPQAFYHRLERDLAVTIRFEAIPQREFHGPIGSVVALAGESSRSFPVRIELDNPEHLIAPGMSARGLFPLHAEGVKEAVLVPADAVIRSVEGNETVWVVNKGNGAVATVEERSVRTGVRQGNRVEMVSGSLSPGETVVIRGNERLVAGDSVRVMDSGDERR